MTGSDRISTPSTGPSTGHDPHWHTPRLLLAMAMMAIIVLCSNILVQYPINDWLTWGAFTYPVSYLVTDLVNRLAGPGAARRVAIAGFVLAVISTYWLATPRIALASGTAFLVSQLMDIQVFHRLRHKRWWIAPLFSNTSAACVDTVLFWSIAFAGSALPWITWAMGDLAVKLIMAALMVGPFGLLIRQRFMASLPSRQVDPK